MDAAAPYVAQFKDALGNDLNTSLGVTALYDVLKANLNDATKLWLLGDFDRVLSLNLLSAAEKVRAEAEKAKAEEAAAAPADGDAAEIEALLAERTAAKKAKDFATADAIRDKLKDMGITIIDTPQGPKWSRG